MNMDIRSASDYSLTDLTQLLNLSFENYLVPITFNLPQFATMIRKDSVDLSTSRVLLLDEQPAGIALIARRGWSSRVAAMGLVQVQRSRGAGSIFMKKLIQEARERHDRELVLEVIEQNEPAVRLYQKCGFQSVRRLIGLIRKSAKEGAKRSLELIDLRTAGCMISQHGLSDLPWQLSGETIAHLNPPACAYRDGPALVVISNPQVEHVVIWSLLVEPAARGKGLGAAMLRHVFAKHPGKTWHVPAIFPEEFGKLFEQVGFEREALTQFQMKRVLS